MMDYLAALQNAENMTNRYADMVDIILVAHVLSPRGHDNPKQLNCSKTEHFTIGEFNEIYQGIVDAGFFIRKSFFSELELIQDVVKAPGDYSSSIVFNLCRNGLGMNKKTVVPALCDLLSITYTSSGASQCAIARNKWLFSSLLEANGIRCPVSGLGGHALMNRISRNAKVICKSNNESASQGIDGKSIMELSDAVIAYDESTLIQEFIDGYECEVPIFCSHKQCFAMAPVGISFSPGGYIGILTDSASMNNDYSFYDLSDLLPSDISRNIMSTAERVFKLLGMQRYGRVDFRIDKDTNRYYVIDIATTPYITKHSSFAYAVNMKGGKYTDIYRLIIAATEWEPA